MCRRTPPADELVRYFLETGGAVARFGLDLASLPEIFDGAILRAPTPSRQQTSSWHTRWGRSTPISLTLRHLTPTAA